MNLEVLKTFGGPKVQRAALQVQKFAPEILTGVGIAGVVGSTILIARAATRLEPIVDEFQSNKDILNEIGGTRETDESFDEKQYKKDLLHVHFVFGRRIAKEFGPGVSLSVASLAAILAAHGIMQRRTVALMGAYKAVESAFQAYRSRVIEEFGEEKDHDYRMGVRTQTIEDPETGKKKKVKTQGKADGSIYARVFDEFNPNYRGVSEYNVLFLKNTQNQMNDLLLARGHVFLNEVYDVLGFDRTHAGQIVGWVLAKDGVGDNYIDFGIWGSKSESAIRFINGDESAVWLDFNVDGNVIDLI
jgi:hypothetical protein